MNITVEMMLWENKMTNGQTNTEQLTKVKFQCSDDLWVWNLLDVVIDLVKPSNLHDELRDEWICLHESLSSNQKY